MFRTVLRLLAIACILAGLIHALLGVGGDWIIGVTPAAPVDPSLDSQNRFYGTAFMLYGFLLWIGSTDLRRYETILRVLFAAMFLAGCARGLAVLQHGWPSLQIMLLWATELSPPIFWIWLNRNLAKSVRWSDLVRLFKSFWARQCSFPPSSDSVFDGPKDEAYAIYTANYDLEVTAVELEMELPKVSTDLQKGWLERGDFRWVEAEKSALAIYDDQRVARQNLISGLLTLKNAAEFSNTVVVILVDQSGSMNGDVIEQVAATTRSLAECLIAVGVSVELLGYSTAGWHGGFARQEWINAGRPSRPGRLCSLLHIIYKSAEEPLLDTQSWRMMLNPDILRENIDGEALLWGWERLKTRSESRKILFIVSDGAPVDDSTLAENGPSYLWRHVTKVINDLENGTDVELAAVGVGHEFDELYNRSVNAVRLCDLFPISANFVIDTISQAN